MKKSINNQGFSLVELIIVIAIMAILIGVLAPNLMRYVERTNVSADTQMADALRSAIITGGSDPQNAEPATTSFMSLVAIGTQTSPIALNRLATGRLASDIALTLTLGSTANTGALIDNALVSQLRSVHNATATFQVYTSNQAVIVRITETDNSGGRSPASANWITVGN